MIHLNIGIISVYEIQEIGVSLFAITFFVMEMGGFEVGGEYQFQIPK